MAALIATVLAEVGGRTPWLTTSLAERTRAPAGVLIGAGVALALVMGLAAVMGGTLAPRLTPQASQLMLGLSLVLAGVAGFMRVRPEPMARWTAPPVVTAFVGVGVHAVGDAAPFVVFTLAAHYPLPFAAAVGGVIGALAVVVPLTLAGERARLRLPLALLRQVGGAVFLVAGTIVGLSALRLI